MYTKTLIGGLIASVAFFLLGWLIYGMLLKDTMAGYMSCQRPEAEVSLLWAILANLLWGWLFAFILSKWGTISTFSAGALAGGLLGGAIALTFDVGMYAYSTMWTSATGIPIDVVINIVMGAIGGGLIGWWFGRK